MSNQICTFTHTHTHKQACERSHSRRVAGLHVDGVSMLLAQGFVLLGVERLTLEVYVANLHIQETETGAILWLVMKCVQPLGPLGSSRPKNIVHIGPQSSSLLGVQSSYRTDETGIMPGVTQSLNELITSFNREVTAVTFGAEQSDVIWN